MGEGGEIEESKKNAFSSIFYFASREERKTTQILAHSKKILKNSGVVINFLRGVRGRKKFSRRTFLFGQKYRHKSVCRSATQVNFFQSITAQLLGRNKGGGGCTIRTTVAGYKISTSRNDVRATKRLFIFTYYFTLPLRCK
jgi:hypothetical protein